MSAKIITFLGPPYSGRTTLALNLAAMLSKQGKSILYIDANQLYGSAVTHIDFDDKKSGLSTAAAGVNRNVILDSISKNEKYEIDILTLPNNASCLEMIDLSELQALAFIKIVKDEYDFMLIDCGPISSEALSAVAVTESDLNYGVIPMERRSLTYIGAHTILFDALNIDVKYIINNIHDIPEISENELLNQPRCKAVAVMPYIPSARKCKAEKVLLMSDKKASAYIAQLDALLKQIKGAKYV